jgi:hypothetical protein
VSVAFVSSAPSSAPACLPRALVVVRRVLTLFNNKKHGMIDYSWNQYQSVFFPVIIRRPAKK